MSSEGSGSLRQSHWRCSMFEWIANEFPYRSMWNLEWKEDWCYNFKYAYNSFLRQGEYYTSVIFQLAGVDKWEMEVRDWTSMEREWPERILTFVVKFGRGLVRQREVGRSEPISSTNIVASLCEMNKEIFRTIRVNHDLRRPSSIQRPFQTHYLHQ